MKIEKRPLSRQDRIVVQDIDGEVLIYDLDKSKAFCLNPTSAFIWRACDGTRTVEEIRSHVSKKLGATPSEDLVWLAIEQLNREKLLVDAPNTREHFGGLSRRDVIRRIGVGSMVALPIVAGLAAPLAIHANSACVTGGLCTCLENSNTMAGQVCVTSTPCSDSNCRCSWLNDGNMMGTCIA